MNRTDDATLRVLCCAVRCALCVLLECNVLVLVLVCHGDPPPSFSHTHTPLSVCTFKTSLCAPAREPHHTTPHAHTTTTTEAEEAVAPLPVVWVLHSRRHHPERLVNCSTQRNPVLYVSVGISASGCSCGRRHPAVYTGDPGLGRVAPSVSLERDFHHALPRCRFH